MKTVCLIPIWDKYLLNNNSKIQDFTILAGRPLLAYSIEKSNKSKYIDETIVYTNSDKINLIDSRLKFQARKRDKGLDQLEISIEDVVRGFLSEYECEILVLMHPRALFIKPETIDSCIEKVMEKKYDSALLVREEKNFVWFKGKSLNYSTKERIPNLSEIEPVLIENNNLYIFTKEKFIQTDSRVGDNPFFKKVSSLEGISINSDNDLKIAEFLIDSGYIYK